MNFEKQNKYKTCCSLFFLLLFSRSRKNKMRNHSNGKTSLYISISWLSIRIIMGLIFYLSVTQILIIRCMQASRVALCTSGTAAVELQLAQLPCVVAYRAHFLTECLIRYKAKIPYISLPNILLNSPVIPEALFGNCKPSRLAPLLM